MGYQTDKKRKLLEKAHRRQNGLCNLCELPLKLKDANADHVVPKSEGGGLVGNIAAVHKHCNRWRGNMTVEEYREKFNSGFYDAKLKRFDLPRRTD